MNYFDHLEINQRLITVLGVNEQSDFALALKDFVGKPKTVFVPDDLTDYHFKVHTPEQIEEFKAAGFLIGVVSIDVLEKKICDIVDGANDFCIINNLFEQELIYSSALARVIQEREQYDLLYIDGVDSEAKRFLARELAKCIKNGMGIRMIEPNDDFTEILVRS